MADYRELRLKDLELAKKLVRESVSDDQQITNAISNIEEIQKVSNSLSKRVREWYSLHLPELVKEVSDNKQFLDHVLKTDKHSYLHGRSTMGADLSQEHLHTIREIAKTAQELIAKQEHLEKYLETIMKRHCANLYAVAGSLVGARLLRSARSLKDLAMMRSSTIQLLGAEKALFRHIRTGARPPKYGYLIQHPLVVKAPRDMKGKIARALADKIFMAARIDFFKGSFMGDKLLKEVEVKLK